MTDFVELALLLLEQKPDTWIYQPSRAGRPYSHLRYRGGQYLDFSLHYGLKRGEGYGEDCLKLTFWQRWRLSRLLRKFERGEIDTQRANEQRKTEALARHILEQAA